MRILTITTFLLGISLSIAGCNKELGLSGYENLVADESKGIQKVLIHNGYTYRIQYSHPQITPLDKTTPKGKLRFFILYTDRPDFLFTLDETNFRILQGGNEYQPLISFAENRGSHSTNRIWVGFAPEVLDGDNLVLELTDKKQEPIGRVIYNSGDLHSLEKVNLKI